MKAFLHRMFFSIVLVCFIALGSSFAEYGFGADDKTTYAAGTLALNEQRWADAVAAFDRVVNAKGKRVDAALYWKAYSLNKLGQGSLALATCSQLHSNYPASSWNRDCSALTLGVAESLVPSTAREFQLADALRRNTSGIVFHADNPDADLKILALNSLLYREPAQAIPLLRGILSGDQSSAIKQHAIFVLAQSESPEAQRILQDLVLGKLNPSLQRQAIQMSSMFRGKRENESLAQVYRTTTDMQIKQAVVSAFFISGDAPRMVELARAEKNLELKRSIVAQLALMSDKVATDYVMELLK